MFLRRLALTLGALASLTTTQACDFSNKTTVGSKGEISFTPSNCGLLFGGCSFSRSLLVGTTVDIAIEGIDQRSGVELTSTTDVLTLSKLTTTSWRATVVKPGESRLEVHVDGAFSDSMVVDTVESRLEVNVSGATEVTQGVPDGDRKFELGADKEAVVILSLKAADGLSAMGRSTITITGNEGVFVTDQNDCGESNEDGCDNALRIITVEIDTGLERTDRYVDWSAEGIGSQRIWFELAP